LGRVGVWSITLSQESASFEREAAAEVERLGFGTLWVGELPKSKEALAHSAILLGATQRLMVAAGIANIWARDAIAASNGANALAEAFGRRFLLGLGVSHSPLVSTPSCRRGAITVAVRLSGVPVGAVRHRPRRHRRPPPASRDRS
jgi:alkanesulfonate monooxygenase SsuD/methylene tetrahydromethanopterin reductase-like flavin-dependent oxidoreductase (luciferase family)